MIDMSAQITDPEVEDIGQHDSHIELTDDGLCHESALARWEIGTISP